MHGLARLSPLALVAVLSSAACRDATPRHPDARGAVDRCLAATGTTAPTGQAAELAARVAASCAELYVEQACRDAHLALAKVGGGPTSPDWIASFSRAQNTCREVYCPLLPGDKPALCTPAASSPTEPAALAAAWNALRTEIYKLDLGASEAARLTAGFEKNGQR